MRDGASPSPWYTTGDLAPLFGFDPRTVRHRIDGWEQKGWIKVRRSDRGDRTVHYASVRKCLLKENEGEVVAELDQDAKRRGLLPRDPPRVLVYTSDAVIWETLRAACIRVPKQARDTFEVVSLLSWEKWDVVIVDGADYHDAVRVLRWVGSCQPWAGRRCLTVDDDASFPGRWDEFDGVGLWARSGDLKGVAEGRRFPSL